MALSVCFVFTITIGVFPAVTVEVRSTAEEGGDWRKSFSERCDIENFYMLIMFSPHWLPFLLLTPREILHSRVLLLALQLNGLGRTKLNCKVDVGKCGEVHVLWLGGKHAGSKLLFHFLTRKQSRHLVSVSKVVSAYRLFSIRPSKPPRWSCKAFSSNCDRTEGVRINIIKKQTNSYLSDASEILIQS